MQRGEIVLAKVKSLEEYGLYLEYKEKVIFVTIVNITWTEIDREKCQHNTEYKVKIIKSFKEAYRGVDYLGSIKDAYPEGNPWKDESIYHVGAKFSGTVVRIAEYGIIVRLSTDAIGLVKYSQEKLPIHSHVMVEVVDADIDKKRILLKLLSCEIRMTNNG